MGNILCYQQATRESPRFKALPRALVFFPQDPETLPHHIVDISDSGLSFRYLGETIKHTGNFSVSLYHENDLVVSDLPVKDVSDIGLSDGLVPVHRGSLCFESLSFEQRNKLVTFIEGFTEPLHIEPTIDNGSSRSLARRVSR